MLLTVRPPPITRTFRLWRQPTMNLADPAKSGTTTNRVECCGQFKGTSYCSGLSRTNMCGGQCDVPTLLLLILSTSTTICDTLRNLISTLNQHDKIETKFRLVLQAN